MLTKNQNRIYHKTEIKAKRVFYILLLFMFVSLAKAQTNTWDGSTSRDWDDPSNWSLNLVPTTAHDVVIPNATGLDSNPIVYGAAVCKTLTISGGIYNNSVTIESTNSLAVSGAITIGTPTSDNKFKYVRVNDGTLSCTSINVVATANGTRDAGVILNTGTVTVSGDITMNANDEFTFTGAGTLNIGGKMTGGTFTASTGTVNYNNSGNQPVGIYTYYNLTISGSGNKTSATAAFDVTNDLNVNSGNLVLSATDTNYIVNKNLTVGASGTLTHNVNWGTTPYSLIVRGNLAIDGAFSYSGVSSSHLIMTGAGKTIHTGTAALSILSLDNTTGTISADGPIIVNDNFWVSISAAGGTFETAGNTITANSALLVAGATFNVNGGTVNVANGIRVGYFVADGTLNFSSGTINTGFLNLGDGTYKGIFNHSGGTANIGNLTIDSYKANAYNCLGSPTINISGNWINNKIFTADTSTVNFTATSSKSIEGTLSGTNGSFYNVTFNGVGGAWTNNSPITVTNSISLTNGILTTSATNLLSVSNTTTAAIAGGSNTSFINGPVNWTLPSSLVSGSSYNFPVGKGSTFLPFTLENPTTGAGAVTAQVEAFDSNCGGTVDFSVLSSLSTTEYWSLATTGNFTDSSISMFRPTPIAAFNVIGGCSTVGGLYSSLAGTAGTYGITASNNIDTNRFFAFVVTNSIQTSTISGSSFCPGTAISVPYTIRGAYISGNVFTAQLSDGTGAFSSPTSIGTIVDTAAGTISATIPSSTLAGSGYRIRVIASTPNVIGENNGVDLGINVNNTWTSSWSLGTPISTQVLVFDGNYTLSGSLEGCSCMVNNGKDVVVNSGASLILKDKLTVVGTGTLTFENNASLVQTNDVANSGNITYKRNTTSITKFDYTYWSSPVSSFSLGGVSPTTLADKFYSYDPISDDWSQASSSTAMQMGLGYIIRGPESYWPESSAASYEASFVGVPNNGEYSFSVSSTGSSILLGNPYPSALDADSFLADNSGVLQGTIYFWTHGTPIAVGTPDPGTGLLAYSGDDYAPYNGLGSVAVSGGPAPTGEIASGQGFFGTISGSGSVVYNNSMRSGALSNSNFYKTKNSKSKLIEKNRIWLNLTNGEGGFKQSLVGYITGATNSLDDRFDAESFDGNDFLDFYSLNQDKKLTIQGRVLPFDADDVVPLGFRVAKQGDFTISIHQTDGLLANQDVYLEDTVTQKIVDLKSDTYTFSTAKGTFDNRFVLRYKDSGTTLGTTNLEAQSRNIFVATQDGKITINSLTENIKKVVIYDILGKQIYLKDMIYANDLNINTIKSLEQLLIVKTILENGEFHSDKVLYKP